MNGNSTTNGGNSTQQRHNHVLKVEKYLRAGIIKERDIQYLTIRHDDSCALLANRGLCNCDPDIELWESLYEKKRRRNVAFIPCTGGCDGGGRFVTE